MKLSILIASLPERHKTLSRLLKRLSSQITQEVEIIINIDNQKTIGKKRNDLVSASTGEYVCFIDDDDMVSKYYVKRILNAIKEKPDVVTIEGIYNPDVGTKRRFIHMLNIGWVNTYDVFYRGNNHLCPTKRDIAIQCPFPEINMGEDKKYGELVGEIAKTEHHIEKTMYLYNYKTH